MAVRMNLRRAAQGQPKALKPKRCRGCRELFVPRTSLAVACSPACAVAVAKLKQDERRRRELRAARERLKGRRAWIREAQTAFNAYIRLRDEGKPCICCGRMSEDEAFTGGRWDAGHYRSTGAAPHLRFNEDNCHRQLAYCNQHRSGNAVDYRLGLIARIGLARVEALEANQSTAKWTIAELREIRDTYRRKARELKAARG